MLHVVTALPCEARPLVRHLRLRATVASGGFRLFEGEDLRLVVSGVGKVASAAAVGWLCALRGVDSPGRAVPWLNVGIAGHAELATGEAFLAHRVIDPATGRSQYPVFAFERPCASETLVTLERFEGRYPDGAACDLEASGFVTTASRFATMELVHCFKVVSDNPVAPPGGLSPARVEQLLEGRLEQLLALLDELRAMSQEQAVWLVDPPAFEACTGQWHFTTAGRRRLRRLLRRLRAVDANHDLVSAPVPGARSARDCLEALERELVALPVGRSG